METINNVTSAASKLIWGEGAQADTRTSTNETGGTEPVSGLQGKGTVDEPFDKGNSGRLGYSRLIPLQPTGMMV
jgi:hypothetical protein